jgi:acyl-coenzyme A synthetase/AMP-(fatty) acid ligase
VKYDERGNLVFVGRNDSQIKRLGYRIELGEIDATALAQPGVERACTVFVPDTGELVLCVEAPDAVPTVLEKAVHDALPRYMRPTRIVVVPALPLNANGKTDRPALLALVRSPAPQGPLPPAG